MRRRTLLGTTAGVLTTGIAGCSSTTGTETDEPSSTDGDTETDTATAEPTATDSSYTASIVPVGEVTFEEVPETYLCYNGAYADMAFALGKRDGFETANAMIPGFFFEPFGLDVPAQSELPALWQGSGWAEEVFYEIEPDVMLMDPNMLHGTGWDDSWDESDTAELRENVAPFFGNNCRRRREFHDYKLYSLYGAFERVAEAFQERERFEAVQTVHDEMLADVQSRIPEGGTEIGLINGGSDPSKGSFYPMNTGSEGYEMKPYRDLNVGSAFPEDTAGQIDYERLLEVDPEIIVVHWGIGTTTPETDGFDAQAFREAYVEPMENDEVGSQLTAVQNGRVYPGQYGEQGPITNLLQTEMTAQQLYPEEFGEFDPNAFPAVPEGDRLFDRERVREIIAREV
jgi:iron complex transport system substrate-binding protein